MILLGRKALLALALALIPLTSVWQPGIISMVFALSICAVWRAKPYTRRIDMVLELASTVLLWITYSVTSSANYAYALQHEHDENTHIALWLTLFAWLMTIMVALLLTVLTLLSLRDDLLEYMPLIGKSMTSWIRAARQYAQQQARAWKTRWHVWLVLVLAVMAVLVGMLEVAGVIWWIVTERLVVYVMMVVELIIVALFIVLY